jgi:hypothetical protein
MAKYDKITQFLNTTPTFCGHEACPNGEEGRPNKSYDPRADGWKEVDEGAGWWCLECYCDAQ